MHDALQLVAAHPAALLLACAVALAASILAGLSGFGTGLVLPLFLVPLVGVANVIPVMAVAMVLNNGSRIVAFWGEIQWAHVRRMLALGLPACAAGAYGYTLLSASWIGLLLGAFLLLGVVVRRYTERLRLHYTPGAELGAGALFGFVDGGMTGTGVILISILMSGGLQSAALVATDACISVVLGAEKVVLFGRLAALSLPLALTGLLVGLCTVPGAFIARALLRRIPARIHAWFMELIVVAGALTLIWHSR